MKRVNGIFHRLLVVGGLLLVTAGCSLLKTNSQLAQISELEERALVGEVSAQLELGNLYQRGELVALDLKQAFRWYELAALQGSAEGAYQAGLLLLRESEDKAIVLLEQSANSGYALAQLKLGDLLSAQSGRVKAEQIYDLYLSAARQGNQEAQYNVAELLVSGKGVERDLETALYWYRESASQGDRRAQLAVGNFYLIGIEVVPSIRSALAWYRQAAIQGSVQAQANMGDLLTFDRYSAVRNYEEGARWYKEAAASGHAHSEARLGKLYENGSGVPRDIALAANWYRRSAEKGNSSAQCRLGSLYFRGLGVPSDAREAEHWFRLAASQIPSDVTTLLGFMYYDCEEFDAIAVKIPVS